VESGRAEIISTSFQVTCKKLHLFAILCGSGISSRPVRSEHKSTKR